MTARKKNWQNQTWLFKSIKSSNKKVGRKKSRRCSRHRPTQSIRAQKRATGRIFYRASIVFFAGIRPGHRYRRTSQNRGCSTHPGRRSNQSSQICHALKKALSYEPSVTLSNSCNRTPSIKSINSCTVSTVSCDDLKP